MRYTFAAAALLLGAGLWAQEGPKISSAIIEFDRNHDTARAKTYIEEAANIISNKNLSEVKTKDLAKFYYYQGKINHGIALSKTPAINALDDNALTKAADAYQKLIDLEEKEGKERYSSFAKIAMYDVANAYINQGVAANDAKDFKSAYEKFYKAYSFKLENEMGTDTTMLYNASLMAQSAKDYPNAIKTTEQLIEMGYKGLQFTATDTETGEKQAFASRNQMLNALKVSGEKYVDPVVDGDLRADLYINLANLYKTSGDTAQYDVVVAEGRKMFPGNKSLLLLELQKYLDTKQYDKAMVNLEQAMINDPTNDLYPYLQGFFYHTEIKDYEKAKAAYKKAIALNPDKIEAQYMSGLIYVDRANAIAEEINGLKLNETAKYEKLQKEQQEAFKSALPFFEKARQIDPKDIDTLKALKEVYYKLKMYEEAKEVQAAIEANTK